LPVLTLIPDDETYGKMLSNLEEVRSRGGQVIAVTTAGKGKFPTGSSHTVCVPKTNRYLTPVLLSIPLHLLAYHIAVLRKCNVDQPRNLAKSVTVE
jgi:glucosamine--fructose-6-phosphate aminotransferase (isomerizing)